jgi:hypothetical protein
MVRILPLLALCCLFGCILAQSCSPTTQQLTRWSTLYGSQRGDISITANVLLDMNVDVTSITIQSGASLHFDWTKDLNVTTQYILNQGTFNIGSESCPYTRNAVIYLKAGSATYPKTITGSGVYSLHGAKGLGKSWTKLSATAAKGATTISVVDEVFTTDSSGWKVGDEIVLATTDYSPYLNDRATIVEVIDARTARLSRALAWTHFGQIAQGVDMRGEVGLLSRSITVIGAPDGAVQGKSNGAVITFAAGPTLRVAVEGVSVVNGGQNEIGKYPFHFHMDGVMPSGTYLRDCAVVDSNFRCVTIHGTHNVVVEGNVAYNSIGHCFFIEDSVEQNNTFSYNLAILTKAKTYAPRLGSDELALSSFWITNTQNDFVGNVAVGCENTGYWIQARQYVTGPSWSSGDWRNYRPVYQPLKSFKGNVAHSCMHGLQADGHGGDDYDNPKVINVAGAGNNPGGWAPSSPPLIESYTAYKIGWRGVWMRTYNLTLNNCRLANCYEGLQLAAEGTHPPASVQTVQNSILVGFSDNKGNNYEDAFQFWLGGDFGAYSKGEGGWMPVTGLKLYDGPIVLKNNIYRNYAGVRVGGGPHAAIGVRFYNPFIMMATNALSGSRLDNVDTVSTVIDKTGDGGRTFNMRDADGSITGRVMSTMLPDYGFYRAPTCLTDAKATRVPLLCPQRYVNLAVLDWTTDGPTTNKMYVTRTQLSADQAPSDMTLPFNGLNGVTGKWRWQPLLSPGSAYLLNWDKPSSSLVFELNNAEIGDTISLAVCYPRGSSITSVQRGNTMMGYITNNDINRASTAVNSRQTVTDNGYYYDSSRDILFFRINQRYDRTQYGNLCPSTGGCDFVWVRANIPAGAAARTDCINSAFGGDSVRDGAATWLTRPFGNTAPIGTITPSAPVAAPVAAPVKPPTAPSVTPVSVPVKPPTAPSVTPVSAPVKPATPVSAPVATKPDPAPVAVPVETPVTAPVTEQTPVADPSVTPVNTAPVTQPATPITKPTVPEQQYEAARDSGAAQTGTWIALFGMTLALLL